MNEIETILDTKRQIETLELYCDTLTKDFVAKNKTLIESNASYLYGYERDLRQGHSDYGNREYPLPMNKETKIEIIGPNMLKMITEYAIDDIYSWTVPFDLDVEKNGALLRKEMERIKEEYQSKYQKQNESKERQERAQYEQLKKKFEKQEK